MSLHAQAGIAFFVWLFAMPAFMANVELRPWVRRVTNHPAFSVPAALLHFGLLLYLVSGSLS